MRIYTVKGGYKFDPKRQGRNVFDASGRFGGGSDFSSSINFTKVKRNFFDWVDQNNSFYFQIIGIFILTLGLVLSFSSLSGADYNDVYAGNEQVSISSNFGNYTVNPESSGEVKPQVLYSTLESDEVNLAEQNEQVEEKIVEYYTVRSGETLYYICGKLEVNCDEVKRLNGLVYPYSLSIHQNLEIPKK